jgi:hypothetical protein
MSITPEKYARTTFYVEAIRITLENFEDVAKWCGGETKLEKRGPDRSGTRNLTQFIEVPVNNPLSDKQKWAYVGNWVLKAGTGFKVYTDKAFQACFYKALPITPEEIWQDDMLPLSRDEVIHKNWLGHQRPDLFESTVRNDIATNKE